MKRRLHISREIYIYLGLWTVVFLIPVLSFYVLTRSHSEIPFHWDTIFHIWKSFAIFFIAFLIHNHLLAPLIVYHRRSGLYLASVFCLTVIFALVRYEYVAFHEPYPPRQHINQKEWHTLTRQGDTTTTDASYHNHPMKMSSTFNHRRLGPPMPFQPDIISILMLLSLFGFNIGVKIFFKTEKDRTLLQQLESKNMEQQLEYLKYQISPHFFMNTLNNIHALIDINPEKAKDTLVELSKMMRYLLYEADKPLVPLQREDQFIYSYIKLMRLRFTEKVEISIERQQQIPNAMVPPLLTINFVENAFKHGICYQHASFIHIKMNFDKDKFYFECVNSKHPESMERKGGVGLKNTRKRLDLLFGDNYQLDIQDQDDTYNVRLQFPIQPINTANA